MTNLRQHIKKQRHHFADKGLYNQSYGFSSSHVQMWELDHKEGWALKNWCFQIVVLENTLESPFFWFPLVSPKGNQPWIFTGRTDAEAEAPILSPPDVKNWLIGKDPDVEKDQGQEGKGMREEEMVNSITDSMDMSLSKFWEIVKDREAWNAAIHGVAKRHTLATEQPQKH